MPSRLVAGLIASGLVLTACSSSGGNRPASSAPASVTSSSSPPPSSAATTPPPVTSSSAPGTSGAPSHDTLAGIVLQPSDLPGYTSKPSTPDDDTTQQQVVACVGSTSVNPADKIEEVKSDDFSQGSTTVSSSATSYKTQAAVDALTAVIRDPKAQGCLEQSLKQQLAASGATVKSIDLTVTTQIPGAPPSVIALLKGQVDVAAQGQEATIYLAQAFLAGKQLTGTVNLESINTPLDLNKITPVVLLPVVQRVEAA